VTTLGVVVKAGSRHEIYETSGICHVLRASAGLSTKNHTAFGITRYGTTEKGEGQFVFCVFRVGYKIH
jgi:predicted Zn-dependent peptidase